MRRVVTRIKPISFLKRVVSWCPLNSLRAETLESSKPVSTTLLATGKHVCWEDEDGYNLVYEISLASTKAVFGIRLGLLWLCSQSPYRSVWWCSSDSTRAFQHIQTESVITSGIHDYSQSKTYCKVHAALRENISRTVVCAHVDLSSAG